MTDNERKVQKRTAEDIVAQAEKIAHLPDVNCDCGECMKDDECMKNEKCMQNTQKYYENQLTNMYAQLNAQNRMIQEQSQTLMQIIREVVPLMQKIEKHLSENQ